MSRHRLPISAAYLNAIDKLASDLVLFQLAYPPYSLRKNIHHHVNAIRARLPPHASLFLHYRASYYA